MDERTGIQNWDTSCRYIDIQKTTLRGTNRVSGTLKFQKFETSTYNHTFYANKPLPACNLAVAGDFRFVKDRIISENHALLDMPLNLSEHGWPHYHGIIEIQTEVTVSAEQSENIGGIGVELIAADALEVLLDGVSLGQGILPPYQFIKGSTITEGKHVVILHIADTSANMLEEPVSWGVKNIVIVPKAGVITGL